MTFHKLAKYLRWWFIDQFVFYMAEPAEDLDDDDPPPEFTWPEEWRTQLAGEDEKALKQLERYKTPADIWTKARSLEQQISSGEFKRVTPFPKDGTDEEKNEWRKQQGIPEAADKYQLSRQIETDEEKAAIQPFLEFAHSNNLHPDVADAVVNYFYETSKADQDAIAQADQKDSDTLEDTLRAEWGDDYRLNQNKVASVLDMVPEGAKELLDARMPDGTKLANNPAFQKFLLMAADSINPTLVVPKGGGDVMSSIMDEMEEIKKIMGTREYTKEKRARYRELLTEMDRLGKLPEVPK